MSIPLIVDDPGQPESLDAALLAGVITEAEHRERLRAHAFVLRAGPKRSPGAAPPTVVEVAEQALAQLDAVLAAVRRYLDLHDSELDYVVAALAAAVSKCLTDEEPLWLMLIGPPGGGKTEAIRLLDRLADASVDELTRAGLLSWSPGKKAKRVGLLTRIPPVSFVTVSDFSTVVTASDREGRARMFGMLRVVYDGRVRRSIGGEPGADGDELAWEGHLTFVAGATPAIDPHTSFEAALGERWLAVRLPESSPARARRRAMFVVEREAVPMLRAEAQALGEGLVRAARARVPHSVDPDCVELLADVAVLVAAVRTGVQHEGQGRSRVPVGLPIPEEPTRLVGQLHRLARCLVALGLPDADVCDLARRIAFDSVPPARMRAFRTVADAGEDGATVADVHRGLGRGNRWAAIWELDALAAIGLVEMEGPEREDEPKAVRRYRLAEEWRDVYESVALSRTLPPTSRGEATDSHTPGANPDQTSLQTADLPAPTLPRGSSTPASNAARARISSSERLS